MAKKMTATRQENLDIAKRAREEGLATTGELWPQTKLAVRALWAMEAAEAAEAEPEAPKAVKVKTAPRWNEAGPRGGSAEKRNRIALATKRSGEEWGVAHREAWKALEGVSNEDMAKELGIFA